LAFRLAACHNVCGWILLLSPKIQAASPLQPQRSPSRKLVCAVRRRRASTTASRSHVPTRPARARIRDAVLHFSRQASKTRRSPSLFAAAALLCALPSAAAPPRAPASGGLGTIRFPNSGAPAAQTAFVEGVKALHSFEFDEAALFFKEAQRADP